MAIMRKKISAKKINKALKSLDDKFEFTAPKEKLIKDCVVGDLLVTGNDKYYYRKILVKIPGIEAYNPIFLVSHPSPSSQVAGNLDFKYVSGWMSAVQLENDGYAPYNVYSKEAPKVLSLKDIADKFGLDPEVIKIV